MCLHDAEGSLLVLIYIHNILPPSCFHLALSRVMPCTLAHPFVLSDNDCRMQPPTFQTCKLNVVA